MRDPVVLVYRTVDGSEPALARLQALGCRVYVERLSAMAPTPSAEGAQADILVGATFSGGVMGAEFIDQFPNLRLISKYTIGFEDVDLAAATARSIAVTHCPTEANWGGVAEGTLALLLASLKKIAERDRQVKSGGWRDPALEGVYLGQREDGYAGISIGIIGLGRVGSRLAELLQPWRVRVLAADPYVAPERFTELGVHAVSFETLLQESDVVTVHCNLTEETRGLVNQRALLKMRSNAMLINTARGAIVDFDALLEALMQDQISSAALDVFPLEPPIIDHRIESLSDRLILSPHMVAANRGGTLRAAVPWAHKAATDALAGRFPARVVNREVEDKWYQRFGAHSLLRSVRASGSAT